jgi:proline iminopeptidase
MTTAVGQRVPVRDTELFVTGTGSGTPVLVLHGGLGIDHTYFRPWLDALGDVAELVFYDHRGNGRSARPPLDDADHATWVADADALRERLGHEQVVLLGHSYGGFLALRYALAHPERVKALVLVSTAATVQHWERVHENLAARSATPAQLRAFEDRPFTDDADMLETLQALMPMYFHRPDPDLLGRLGAGLQVSAEASRAGGRCLADYDVRGDLARLDVPTLVLSGRHDFIMPPDVTAEPLAAAVPGAELVVFEDSGHFPFIEEDDAFMRVVRRFLGSLS